jgi:hypothetical protein
MNKRAVKISACVFLVFLSLPWSSSAIEQRTVLPSDLAADPLKYDGKHVTVRGYIVLKPESRNIFDSEAGTNDPHGTCLGLRGSDLMFKSFHRKKVERISGIFKRKLCADNEVCPYWCYSSGAQSGIVLDKGSRP